MKIFAISDLHLSINNPKPMNIFGEVWDNYLDQIESSWEENVSDDDVVLICGDISWAMKMSDVQPDIDYIGNLRGKKVIIRGNHDYWWSSISALRSMLPVGMFAVQNDSVRIGNAVICGSRGWLCEDDHTGPDDKKIYDRELIRMRLSLDSAKAIMQDGDSLVVMTHYPPFNFKAEPNAFTRLFEEYGVSAVVYGHLHGKNARAIPMIERGGIKYYLSSCDLVKNKLVRIL